MNEQCTNSGSGHAGSATETQSRHVGATQQRIRFAPMSTGGRLVGFAAAVLAATVCVGSQIGLLAMYSGEAELALAALSPPSAASQVVASAITVGRRSQYAGTKFDAASGQRWPWMHNYGRSEE